MGKLEGKAAIVVGASSGVGYGAALRFAEEGANVVACARRLKNLEALKEDAAARGFTGEILPVRCDIGNEIDLDNVVAVCKEKFGHIDILACIAQGGLNDMRDFEQTDAENLRIFYEGGPVYTLQLIQKCLPYMKEQHYGRILTCASGAGQVYTPHTTAYGMAKAAIINMTRTCAQELGEYGITTNCFCPVIINDYFEQGSGGATESLPVEIMNMLSPVGYMGKAYEDGSQILAFLCSDEGHYINGQVINVDGAMGHTSAETVLEGMAKMASKTQQG